MTIIHYKVLWSGDYVRPDDSCSRVLTRRMLLPDDSVWMLIENAGRNVRTATSAPDDSVWILIENAD